MSIFYFSHCCGAEGDSSFVMLSLCPRCRQRTEFDEVNTCIELDDVEIEEKQGSGGIGNSSGAESED